MSSPSLPVFDAIRTALRGDAALRAWSGATLTDSRVYDGVPAGTEPGRYVVLGDAFRDKLALMRVGGSEERLRISIWGPGPGKRAPLEGEALVAQVLERRAIVLPGEAHLALSCRWEFIRTQTDPDRKATQAIGDVVVHVIRAAPPEEVP